MQIRYLEMVQELGKGRYFVILEGVVLMMEVGVKKKGFKH